MSGIKTMICHGCHHEVWWNEKKLCDDCLKNPKKVNEYEQETEEQRKRFEQPRIIGCTTSNCTNYGANLINQHGLCNKCKEAKKDEKILKLEAEIERLKKELESAHNEKIAELEALVKSMQDGERAESDRREEARNWGGKDPCG